MSDQAGDQFIVLCRQIVGSSLETLHTETHWDGEFHRTRKLAIKDGYAQRGSDDFNIGVVRKGKLVSIDWMNEPLGESAGQLADVAYEICLSDD